MRRKIPPAFSPQDIPPAPGIAGVAPVPRGLAVGERLFREGDPTVGIFFVAAGRLRMQRVTADGTIAVMHVARAGEMLAEASLFVERYRCEVVAETDCVVWEYPKRKLARALRNDPDSLWSFAEGLARGLHGLRLRYEIKQIRSAPGRVLQWLRLHCGGDGVFTCEGRLQDLAHELGLTREALYRALATLQKRGILQRTKDRLVIATPSSSVFRSGMQ